MVEEGGDMGEGGCGKELVLYQQSQGHGVGDEEEGWGQAGGGGGGF